MPQFTRAALSAAGIAAALSAARPALASDDTPVIEEATTAISEGRIGADILTTLPVFREDVRVKIDGRTLVVYLTGAVIEGGKRTFGEGSTAIRALPRATYSKLEVPLPPGVSCAGPASIELQDTIVHVSVPCGVTGSAPAAAAATGTTGSWAGLPRGGAVATERAEAPRPRESRRAEALAARLGAIETAPKAETVEAVKPEPKAEAKAPAKAEVLTAKAPAPLPVIEATPPPPAEAQPPVKSTPAPRASSPVVTTEARPLPAERTSPFVIAGGLAALGIAGYLLWRRRQEQKLGMIRILETASLGPKRTLVVAEIDGEKMILGTSEAGISVLTPASRLAGFHEQTTGGTRIPMPPGMGEATLTDHHIGPKGYAMAAAGAMGGGAAAAIAAPAAVAIDASDENEGGILARLFRRREPEIDVSEDVEELGNMEDEFRDLLADSIEDEELRRRLQAGLGGRTS